MSFFTLLKSVLPAWVDADKSPRSCLRSSGGLVLIELVVVMGIILILFLLYFGSGTRNFQRKRQAECRQNLQFVYSSLQTFANENNGKFPYSKGATSSEVPLSLLVPRYTTRTKVFICPGSKDRSLPEAQPFETRRISYSYLMASNTLSGADQWVISDEQVNTRAKAPNELLFSQTGKFPGNNHRQFGGNLLFCDGRAESSPPLAKKNISGPPHAIALNPKP